MAYHPLLTFQKNTRVVKKRSCPSRCISSFAWLNGKKILSSLSQCYSGLIYFRVIDVINRFLRLNSSTPRRRPVFRSCKFHQYHILRIQNCIRRQIVQNNEVNTTRDAVLSELGFDVKPTMMKRLRRSMGYESRSSRSGHMIRKVNKEKRLLFCKSSVEKSVSRFYLY